MSLEHPIVAITGSSGAGTSYVTKAFERIFRRERVRAVYIQGSAFHRYERTEMQEARRRAHEEGGQISHFGPEGNFLDKLETLFFQYSATGTGMHRHYLHTREFADIWGQEPGTLTPWEELEGQSDLLFYRGLHGAAIVDDIDISQYPDLIIGVVPSVNLEWIRKITRDCLVRDYSPEDVKQSILDRMHDYVHHITPQFGRTHINLQMVPAVDTSDPFSITEIPQDQECFMIVHFRKKIKPDFVRLLKLIPNSFMSRTNTIVIPGRRLAQSLEVIMTPLVHELVLKSREIRQVESIPTKQESGLFGHWGQNSL